MIGAKPIDVVSGPSNIIRVDDKDVFPPLPPEELAAVAVADQGGDRSFLVAGH